MNGLTGEQIDKIKARLDALECIQGILSRVRTLGDKDWRLGCIYNHTAYPLNDEGVVRPSTMTATNNK